MNHRQAMDEEWINAGSAYRGHFLAYKPVFLEQSYSDRRQHSRRNSAAEQDNLNNNLNAFRNSTRHSIYLWTYIYILVLAVNLTACWQWSAVLFGDSRWKCSYLVFGDYRIEQLLTFQVNHKPTWSCDEHLSKYFANRNILEYTNDGNFFLGKDILSRDVFLTCLELLLGLCISVMTTCGDFLLFLIGQPSFFLSSIT